MTDAVLVGMEIVDTGTKLLSSCCRAINCTQLLCARGTKEKWCEKTSNVAHWSWYSRTSLLVIAATPTASNDDGGRLLLVVSPNRS